MIIDMDGFESGLVLSPNSAAWSTGNFATALGRDGTGVSLRGGTSNTGVSRAFTSGSDTIFLHLGYFISAIRLGDTAQAYNPFSIAADLGGVFHITMGHDNFGRVVLRRGTSTGTVLQTSALSAFNNAISAWYSIEAKITIHDTLGEVIIKVNGVEFINYTGDTKNGGTSTRPDVVYFGIGNSANSIDDWLLCDTTGGVDDSWPGEITIVGVRPAANGANNALVGSDGNSVNNFQQVDEFPWTSTDYNGSPTVGAMDTYDMTPVGKLGTVVAVQPQAYIAKSDAGVKTFKHVQRGGSGGVVKSSVYALSTTYTNIPGPIWKTDGDGNAWTVARVDASEFGIEVNA